MFYVSPWMLYGIVLGIAYFLLVLFGCGGKRKTNVSKPRKSSTTVAGTINATEDQPVKLSSNDFGQANRVENTNRTQSALRARIREATYSGQISDDCKSVDKLTSPPANAEEKLGVELVLNAVKSEDLEKSKESYLLKFDDRTDFIPEEEKLQLGHKTTKHESVNCTESEDILKSLPSGSIQTNQRESKGVNQKLSSNENNESIENIVHARKHEQASYVQVDSGVLESCTSHENKRKAFVGNFAENLVDKATSEAFHGFGFESVANQFADIISTEIVCDAIGQFVQKNHLPDELPEVQELQLYAGNFVSSLIKDASENVSVVRDMECFACELSEQVIHEGIEQFVTNAKVEEVRKKKVSLTEMKIFSECIISEVVSDGIDEAAEQENVAKETSANKTTTKKEDHISQADSDTDLSSTLHSNKLEDGVPFSTSLQPHIGGVVENLVNGAISEAVSRIQRQKTLEGEVENFESRQEPSHDNLESQLSNSVHNLIVSALSEAALGPKTENQTPVSESSETEHVLYNASVTKDDMESQDFVIGDSTSRDNIPNGHVDHSEGLLIEDVVSYSHTAPQIFIKAENDDRSDGIDVVPDQALEATTAVLQEQKASEGGDYWRRSLILDLEGDDELDESFGSEKSPTSTEELVSTPKDEDEESAEFVDSSEDEVIDHAEEAKLGAVGGTHVNLYNKADEEMEFDDDKFDDDDDDDDDMFAPQSMVDGLCVSKPKEKKKKKHKSLPRARIQSADSHFNRAVVIDNGCGSIKLGLAGDRHPRVVQPTVFGVPKRYSLQLAGMDNRKDRKYGDAAVMKAGVMQLEYPLTAGLIENWADVEEIWEYMLLEELGIEEGNHPVLITEIANNSRRNREKIAEILFEHLGVPAMYLANQLVLSMYASGLTMGLCLSSGFSVTQAAAIYEGYILAHTVQQLDIGGKSLTDNLQKLLRESKGLNFNSSSGWQIVNSMKENMVYVAADYAAELKQYNTNAALTKFYTLPDGQTVDISSEMIRTPEPLFVPDTLLGVDDTVASQFPIHKLVNNAYKRCSPELQETINRNVVLSGGTTLFRGLPSRLQQELSNINPKIRSLRTPENRRYSAWVGGSILSSLSSFDGMYITVDEYADHGARVVNQKCF